MFLSINLSHNITQLKCSHFAIMFYQHLSFAQTCNGNLASEVSLPAVTSQRVDC